jgi:peptide/nickel transport system permease protein
VPKLKYKTVLLLKCGETFMGLRAYIAKRIVYMLILIWAVVTIEFIIFNLMPGNPLEQYVAGMRGIITEERMKELRRAFGLDQPLHVQYINTLIRLFTFNFGLSAHSTLPVSQEIMRRLPNTLFLLGVSTVLSIIIGTLIGVITAYKRGGILDTGIVTASLFTYSVPIFFIGYILITIFSIQLKWLPSGLAQPREWIYNPPSNIFEYISGRLYHAALPILQLFLFSVGGWILLARACVLETITEDYVVTARAKGLSERTVLYKHVLKNASLPIITNVALSFAFIVSGAIITETLYSYEGMGLLIYRSLQPPDIPVLQGIFFIIALCVILANFIADLLYGIIDPRVRYG